VEHFSLAATQSAEVVVCSPEVWDSAGDDDASVVIVVGILVDVGEETEI
jgi:hypothetical protein